MSKTKISFRLGITQVFVIAILAVAGAISFNFQMRISDMVLDLSDRITAISAQRIIDNTQNFLGVPASYTAILAEYLENTKKQRAIVENHEELWRLMWKPLLLTPQMQSLFVADTQGNYVQVRRDPEFVSRTIDRRQPEQGVFDYRVFRDASFNLITEKTKPTDFDPRTRPWYKSTPAEPRLNWSDVYVSSSAKTPVIAVTHPVTDTTGKRIRAVAGVNIPLYAVSDFISELAVRKSQTIILIDDQGRLLAYPDKSQLLVLEEDGELRPRLLGELKNKAVKALFESLEARRNAEKFSFFVGGEVHTAYTADFPSYFDKPGWKAIMFAPGTASDHKRLDFEQTTTEIFSFFEQPAKQVRGLSLSFPASDAPLAITRDLDPLWQRMWQPLVTLPQLQSFFIADAEGNYVQTRREPYLATRLIDRSQPNEAPIDRKIYRDEEFSVITEKHKRTEFDPRVRPWYLSAKNISRIHWSSVYVSASAKTPVVAATHPVLTEEGDKAGVVAVNIPLYKVSDFVAESRVSPNGILFIANRAGEVVAYPDKSQILMIEGDKLRLRLVEELDNEAVRIAYQQHRKDPDEIRFTFSSQDANYISLIQPFPKILGEKDWSIVAVIPEDDLLGEVGEMLLEAGTIAALILTLAILLVYILATRISKPIIRLARSMDRFKDFRLGEIRGVHSRFSEIDTMNHSMLLARDGLASFQKYVPADLVRLLIQKGQSARLGGEFQRLTIMFTDIEGFTSISENLPAQELMLHLSEYLDQMTRIILEERGTVDKYIGDAIMAFWGAPTPQPNTAFLACSAALRCQGRLQRLNAAWAAQGKPVMTTRFGLHTGSVIVGNVGSQNRLNYTVVGDGVNLASRLEGINKFYGTQIIVSEDTFQEAREHFHFRLLDRVAVKGKKKGVNIYQLLGPAQRPLPETLQRFCEIYQNGLTAYWERDWAQAATIFLALERKFPKDSSVRLFLKRCEELQRNDIEVAEDWEGTYIFTNK